MSRTAPPPTPGTGRFHQRTGDEAVLNLRREERPGIRSAGLLVLGECLGGLYGDLSIATPLSLIIRLTPLDVVLADGPPTPRMSSGWSGVFLLEARASRHY